MDVKNLPELLETFMQELDRSYHGLLGERQCLLPLKEDIRYVRVDHIGRCNVREVDHDRG